MIGRILRIGAILTGALTLAFAWEYSRARGLEETTGEVVRVERVFGGSTGDDRRFTIEFDAGAAPHRFATGRGITEQLGRYSDLAQGDRVPVVYDPEDPTDARLDTVFHVYPISLTVITVGGIYAVTLLVLLFTGRLP